MTTFLAHRYTIESSDVKFQKALIDFLAAFEVEPGSTKLHVEELRAKAQLTELSEEQRRTENEQF